MFDYFIFFKLFSNLRQNLIDHYYNIVIEQQKLKKKFKHRLTFKTENSLYISSCGSHTNHHFEFLLGTMYTKSTTNIETARFGLRVKA